MKKGRKNDDCHLEINLYSIYSTRKTHHLQVILLEYYFKSFGKLLLK